MAAAYTAVREMGGDPPGVPVSPWADRGRRREMLQIVEGSSARTRLQKALVRILKAEMRPAGTRTIGFPSGNYPLRVVTRGEGRLWAAFSRNEDSPNMRYSNSFGLFEEDRPSLDITVEINVAYEQTAMIAGMVAVDDATGRGYLLHSGRVAGGYPGVGMRAFLARSAWSEARLTPIHDGRRLVGEGVLVGAIEPGISGRIEDYVREVAAFKKWVRGLDGDISSIAEEIEEIGRYRREFAGRLRRGRIKAVDVVVEHGDVVHALKLGRDAVASRGEKVFSTPLIDLYVKKNGRRTEVYEVKSATDRQSLYTAIGQLAVHGSSAGVPRLLLVIPEGPIADDILRTIASMDIEEVRYVATAECYVFDPPLRRS